MTTQPLLAEEISTRDRVCALIDSCTYGDPVAHVLLFYDLKLEEEDDMLDLDVDLELLSTPFNPSAQGY